MPKCVKNNKTFNASFRVINEDFIKIKSFYKSFFIFAASFQ